MEAKKRKITEFFKKPSSVDSEVQNEDIILEEDSPENDPCSSAEGEELSRPVERTFQISWLKRVGTGYLVTEIRACFVNCARTLAKLVT